MGRIACVVLVLTGILVLYLRIPLSNLTVATSGGFAIGAGITLLIPELIYRNKKYCNRYTSFWIFVAFMTTFIFLLLEVIGEASLYHSFREYDTIIHFVFSMVMIAVAYPLYDTGLITKKAARWRVFGWLAFALVMWELGEWFGDLMIDFPTFLTAGEGSIDFFKDLGVGIAGVLVGLWVMKRYSHDWLQLFLKNKNTP